MRDILPSGAEAIFLVVALVATIPLILLLRWVLRELRKEETRTKDADDAST